MLVARSVAETPSVRRSNIYEFMFGYNYGSLTFTVCVSNGLHTFLLTFFRLDAPDLRPHLGLRSRLPTHHALRSLLSRHEAPRRQVADTIFLSMQRCPCKSVTSCQTV